MNKYKIMLLQFSRALATLGYFVCAVQHISGTTARFILKASIFRLSGTEFCPDFSLGYCCCDCAIFPYFLLSLGHLVNSILLSISLLKKPKISGYSVLPLLVGLFLVLALLFSIFFESPAWFSYREVHEMKLGLGGVFLIIGLICLFARTILDQIRFKDTKTTDSVCKNKH